jgi:hypothetical protein
MYISAFIILTIPQPSVYFTICNLKKAIIMKNPFSVVFGGVIAFILLMLYAGTVAYMIIAVTRTGTADTVTFAQGLVFVVTTINGLVSALVVTNLAVTTPGEDPTILRNTIGANGQPNPWVRRLVGTYLSIWLVIGLAALIVGVMIYPDVNTTLKDIGTTWLGLAVAAGYAYFGVTPQK